MSAPVPNSRTPLLAVHNAARSASPTRSRPHSSNRSFIRRPKQSPRKTIPAVLTCILLCFIALVAWAVGKCYFKALCQNGERSDTVWWENSGAYAPWRSNGLGGGKRGLPRGCVINQVTVLHRHAARFPTLSAGKEMQVALDKIARSVNVPKRALAFLAKADLRMEGWHFDHLLDQGRKAAWRSGRELAEVYKDLVETGEGVFVRASGSDRVVETSGYWMEGFSDRPFKLRVRDLPRPNVTIPEGETSNNTLSVHNCPAFNNQTTDLSGLLELLEPTLKRFNKMLMPQPALDMEDIASLADMCPYDSQIEGEDWQAWSKWCGIFTRDEWEIIGHWRDASRYYEVGQGSSYGRTMGAGWVNELLARLTDSAVQDGTTTNRTLDADEASFPQGGRRLFIDFGHDNEMIETITAMGLLKQQRHLPTDWVPDKRTFMTSEIIPFGSRIIFERIGCHLGDWEPDPEAPSGEDDDRKNYVRIFVNDKITPVEHIACQQSGFVEHFMCEVESFVESQAWSRDEHAVGAVVQSAVILVMSLLSMGSGWLGFCEMLQGASGAKYFG